MIEPQVASTSIIPYLDAAKKNGVDIGQFLFSQGLSVDTIQQQEMRIPAKKAQILLCKLIQLADDPWLGLHSSEYMQVYSYDINGYISANCSCPLEATLITEKLHAIISDRKVLSVVENKDELINRWDLPGQTDIVTRNNADHLMASYIKYAEKFLRWDANPNYVTFRHKKPQSTEAIQLYEKIFDCPLLFEQEYYSVSFNRDMARDMIIPQADTLLRDILIGHANRRIHDLSDSQPFTYQVKCIIKKLLNQTVPCRESVADQLNMGSRTLQRRLIAEGSSFKNLFNEVREELALHHLRDSQLSIADIADKLGFSETRSFHRRFKQWTGKTIGEFRAETQSEVTSLS